MMGKYQPFLDLPASHFQALVDDIARHGVLLPIIVDENGKTIDGHQRRRAAAEAGVECPEIVVEGLDEDEKQVLALTLNLFRRHLSGTERSKAITQLANLGLSTRHIGNLLGISKSQVHRNLADVDRPDTVTDSLGRKQPSSKPRDVSHVGHVDPVTRGDGPPPNVDANGEVVSPMGDTETAEGGAVEDPSGDAQEPSTEQESPASPSVPPVDPVLGYRATATSARANVRTVLLTLDPERVIETSDDRKAWGDFSHDVRSWLDALDEQLAGVRLKAVP